MKYSLEIILTEVGEPIGDKYAKAHGSADTIEQLLGNLKRSMEDACFGLGRALRPEAEHAPIVHTDPYSRGT